MRLRKTDLYICLVHLNLWDGCPSKMTILLVSRAKGMPWYKGTRKKLTSLIKVDPKPASTGPATRCCLNLPQILSQQSLSLCLVGILSQQNLSLCLVGSSTVSPLGPASDPSPHSSTQAPLSGTWQKLKIRGISIEYVWNMKNLKFYLQLIDQIKVLDMCGETDQEFWIRIQDLNPGSWIPILDLELSHDMTCATQYNWFPPGSLTDNRMNHSF